MGRAVDEVSFVIVGTVLVGGLAVAIGLTLRRSLAHGVDRDRLEAVNRGLSLRQRWHVNRVVSKGRAVGDPALAGSAVARARYVRTFSGRFDRRGWRWAWYAFAVVQLMIAIPRLLDPGPWTISRVLGVASPLVLAVLLVSLPPMHRSFVRRAERAEQLNLRLHQ